MFFAFNGGKIYYNDIGKGTPVVLLHGYLESSESGMFLQKNFQRGSG